MRTDLAEEWYTDFGTQNGAKYQTLTSSGTLIKADNPYVRRGDRGKRDHRSIDQRSAVEGYGDKFETKEAGVEGSESDIHHERAIRLSVCHYVVSEIEWWILISDVGHWMTVLHKPKEKLFTS